MKSKLKSFQLVQEWTLSLNQEKTYKHFRASEYREITGQLKISYMSLPKQTQQACKTLFGQMWSWQFWPKTVLFWHGKTPILLWHLVFLHFKSILCVISNRLLRFFRFVLGYDTASCPICLSTTFLWLLCKDSTLDNFNLCSCLFLSLICFANVFSIVSFHCWLFSICIEYFVTSLLLWILLVCSLY